ncbi:MAG: 3-phosphoshikimate 1-carboxyvinyltransferase [Gammaproteobacteria bacterium]
MQRYFCQPGSVIGGEISVPGDKSISHRSLMLGGIADGTTEVRGFLESEDCLATLAALRNLGVNIGRFGGNRVTIHGVGLEGFKPPSAPLDMGNAGTAMRLFMGLLAAQSFDSTLVGDSSLMKRPMERVAVPLRLMNASIETQKGLPPVVIKGGQPLKAIDYALPVASAQVKSAILLAALRADGRTRVSEPAPTRDHTERMLSAFGVEVLRTEKGVALEGGQSLRGASIDVPGDFSSAAFFLVLGALSAQKGLTIRGVGINPTRTGLLDMLTMMGADIRVRAKSPIDRPGQNGGPHSNEGVGEPIADIEVHASRLKGITVPEALVPLSIDEFPVFFIAAACAEGETLVRGAHELRVKESDRLAVMAEGLGALGVEHELLPDGIWIRGGKGFSGGSIDSHGDHRIAMAFAVASTMATGQLEIRDVANVATSFPGFVEIARRAGLQIEEA